MRSIATVVLVLTATILASPAGAVVIGDYVGYGYETGGFLPSDAGDELVFTAVATAVDPVTGADLGIQEMTFYAYGLVSDGQTVDTNGNTTVTYTGGKLEIYLDSVPRTPTGEPTPRTPRRRRPSADGALLFEGDFTSFVIIIQADGSGAYEGNLDGVAGIVAQQCVQRLRLHLGGCLDRGRRCPDHRGLRPADRR